MGDPLDEEMSTFNSRVERAKARSEYGGSFDWLWLCFLAVFGFSAGFAFVANAMVLMYLVA